MSKHLQEEYKSAATKVTSTDATRHKQEMKIRGDMVIELAKILATDGEYRADAAHWIRYAREIVEEKHRDR